MTAGQKLIEQGIEQGIKQSIEQTLRRLLGLKFGAVPPWADIRIAGADRAALQGWTDRTLPARTVEEVFAE